MSETVEPTNRSGILVCAGAKATTAEVKRVGLKLGQNQQRFVTNLFHGSLPCKVAFPN